MSRPQKYDLMSKKILSGIRVVDMTEGVAGPYAATLLGDMGAEVIKVERREGDWQRSAGSGEPGRLGNPQYIALNRSKRDIGVDLNTTEGRGIVERLVSKADVVVSNYRAGVMAKLGFDYARCEALRPGIIYCTISGFGQEGTYARLHASDTILQAISGVMSVVGEPDGEPLRVGFPLIDMAAANHAVQSVLLALYGPPDRARGCKHRCEPDGGGLGADVRQPCRLPVFRPAAAPPGEPEQPARASGGVRSRRRALHHHRGAA